MRQITARTSHNGRARLRRARWSASLCALLLFVAPEASLAETDRDDLDIYSTNDFGGIGLLQTRTARFALDGSFNVGVSFVNPFRRYYINWQIFPWLEANFRYTDITNRPVGGQPFDLSQGQFLENLVGFRSGGTFLDRGFDLKARLWREGRIRPALAIGIQDALGTGEFGGEYLVASKRFRRLDLHVGLGWGYLGNRGFLPNPLKIFGGRFDDRNAVVGQGGKPSLGNFFAGDRIALFGGLEYHTGIDGLSFKLEYNGSDPALEVKSGPLDEDIPVNLGFNYRPVSWFDLSLGWERGNSLMIRTSLRANFSGKGIPKKDPVQPAARPDEIPQGELGAIEADLDLIRSGRADLDALYSELEEQGIRVASLDLGPSAATIRASRPTGAGREMLWPLKAARILFRYLPDKVKRVTIHALGGQDGIGGETENARIYTRSGLRLANKLEKSPVGPEGSGAGYQSIMLSARHLELRLAGEGLQVVPPAEHNIPDLSVAYIRSVALYADGALLFETDYLALVAGNQADQLFEYLAASDVDADAITIRGARMEVLSDAPGVSLMIGGDRSIASFADETGIDRISLVSAASASVSGATIDGAGAGADVATRIFRELAQVGYTAYALHASGVEAEIHISKTRYLQVPRNVGWVAKIAARHLPPEIELITVVQLAEGAETSRISVLRADLERYDDGRGSPEETWANARINDPRAGLAIAQGAYRNEDAFPDFSWWLRPLLLQHIGDPDSGIYVADVNLALGGSFSPSPGWRITGEVRQFLFGNLDRVTRASDSSLPRVRSDIVQYLREGRTAIGRLQADYVTSLRPDLYFRASAGLFESMFGGVGAELLYRPHDARWALGGDINWVKQRDFDQLVNFRDYQVLTGHMSLYYDWPFYDLRTIVSAGRYLAGDYGVTIDVSRRFKSGVRVGAFATFTDVGFEEFGEGSFDKAFYVSLPLDLLLPISTRQRSTALFRPLTRDGGQRLSIGPRLFDLVDDSSDRALNRDWGRIFD
ncbi:MAG: YjbH domain-containing protein [Proteobacteria bacterium]|nr:YjbH domain-containing protein [Pseudomonadota bacterium]